MRTAIIFLPGILLSFCRKDVDLSPGAGNKDLSVFRQVEVNIEARFNDKPLRSEPVNYVNSSGDSMNVTKFNYYLSNVHLLTLDGSVFREEESYHLLRHLDGKNTMQVANVPAGRYQKLVFTIGVDSLRNVSGAQTGALDISNDMFWDWDTGYIFFKLEGSSKTRSMDAWDNYSIHIGGFSGKFSKLQRCTLELPEPINVTAGNTPKIFLRASVDEVFMSPKEIGFDYYYSNISETMFKDISINYSDMFQAYRIEH